MLELDPPRHTALRASVLRGFTTRRIASLAPEIEALAHRLLDAAPRAPFDLVEAYCKPLPVIVIARLLGVPEAMAPQLLAWSTAFVAMYRPGPTRADEEAAARSASAFAAYITDLADDRRRAPRNDLISALATADAPLRAREIAATCILLLNAGHEATVHTLGNAVAALAARPHLPRDGATVEEVLRHDPPLHFFARWVNEPCTLYGHGFAPGDRIGLLLGAANRDPAAYPDPHGLDPGRWPGAAPHAAFGGGIHFCLGAALARMEIGIGLGVLQHRMPGLTIASPPRYADIYHFRGLNRLIVDPGHATRRPGTATAPPTWV